ncbi:MAG: DUF4214 domain-containing protein [Candidatus Omnitrophica bacterium]|nr:DUF4214 domain-containing protein [Candidatus Omnitrophota bacterium]
MKGYWKNWDNESLDAYVIDDTETYTELGIDLGNILTLILNAFGNLKADERKRAEEGGQKITELYRNLLFREPDINGLKGWISAYVKNPDISKIELGIRSSSEYKRLQEVINNIKSIYLSFGKEVDMTIIKYWARAIMDGQKSLSDISESLKASGTSEVLKPITLPTTTTEIKKSPISSFLPFIILPFGLLVWAFIGKKR